MPKPSGRKKAMPEVPNRKRRRPSPHPQPPKHDPSLEEIRAECEKLQETWGSKEEWKRRGIIEQPTYSVPRVGTSQWQDGRPLVPQENDEYEY